MIKEKLKNFITKNPETGIRPITIWVSKPWVIILLTIIAMGFALLLTMNQIMGAILHSRPEIVVPKIEGLGILESLRITSELDLALRQDGTEFDESLPAGTVIRQAPPSGMKIRTGRAIHVVISKGGQAAFVPLIMGKAIAEAQSALAVDGLQLGAVSEVFSNDVRSGNIVHQTPSSGTIVSRGAFIDIVISKGFPPEGAPLVPDFVGQRIDNAREWAEDTRVQIKMKEDNKAVGVAGTVVKQFPEAGQPILVGGDLSITVVPLLASKQGFRLSYQVPTDIDDAQVRIVARDNRGESEVYNGAHSGGDTVEIPMSVTVTTRVRIYVNDLLKDERVIEP